MFCGWCLRVPPVAVRSVLGLSCVKKISVWIAFFVAGAIFGDVGGWLLLLRRCTWRFLCEKDEAWVSFFAAGATCGDNAGVPPAALRIALDVSGAELSTINLRVCWISAPFGFWTAFLVVKACACMYWNVLRHVFVKWVFLAACSALGHSSSIWPAGLEIEKSV